MTTHVAQLHLLEIVPNALVGIELGGVARQPLQVEARRASLSEEILDRLAPVDRSAVPEDGQLAWDMAEQMAQEAHDIGTAEGARLDLQEQPPVRRDAADDRQMIPRQGQVQDGRLATRRIGSDHTRQEIEGRLVYPDLGPPFGLGFFLIAGQRCSPQAAMAASSRWVARRIGFCTLQPTWRRRRLTCAG